jgi:hypothetical protein
MTAGAIYSLRKGGVRVGVCGMRHDPGSAGRLIKSLLLVAQFKSLEFFLGEGSICICVIKHTNVRF